MENWITSTCSKAENDKAERNQERERIRLAIQRMRQEINREREWTTEEEFHRPTKYNNCSIFNKRPQNYLGSMNFKCNYREAYFGSNKVGENSILVNQQFVKVKLTQFSEPSKSLNID